MEKDIYCPLSVQLIDKYPQGALVIVLSELDSVGWLITSIYIYMYNAYDKVIKTPSHNRLTFARFVHTDAKSKYAHADISRFALCH